MHVQYYESQCLHVGICGCVSLYDGPQVAPPGLPCACLPPSLLELPEWGEIRVVLQHAGDA